MWQLFTEPARKVVYIAQAEAQKFGDAYVGTEHLLLGLVHESDTVAGWVLAKLGISPDRVRTEVEEQHPKKDVGTSHDMILALDAKRVIEAAYDEARNLKNKYIGTDICCLASSARTMALPAESWSS